MIDRRPPGGRLSLPVMRDLLRALLGATGFAPEMVAGHSAGAAVLCRTALDAPDFRPRRIDSLNGALLPFDGITGKVAPGLARALYANPIAPRVFAFFAGEESVKRLIGNMGSRIDRDGVPGATSGQPFTTIDNDSATATLRHSFSDSLRLTVTGRHSEVSTQEYGSFVYPAFYPPDPSTPTTYPILPIHLDDKATESTVDANLLFKMADPLSGRHEILGGFDYDHTTFRSNLGFDGVPIGTLDLAHPGGGSIAFGLAPAVSVSQTDRFETVAGYLQDQASYGRLHLTGSVRYTRLGLREREEGTDQAYYRVSPRLGATLDLLSGVALYGGYATGIRAAFAYVGLTPPKPQTSRNYEVGLKLALTRLGVSGTLAAFDQTRRNVPTADPNDIHFSIQTGEQRARGGEADLVWEPTPALSVLANYAYTEAEVTQDSAIPVGDKLPRVPRNSGRIAARYRVLNGVAKGLSFGGGITAFDSRALTLPNTVSVPGYATVDAQAAYDFGRFTVEVSAINLNGSKAFDAYEYLGFPVVIPIQPRSAYVTLKTRF